jgi:hypothetical protein
MKHRLLLLSCLLVSFFSSAQNRNSIWCFGDSAGIDFRDTANPVPFTTFENGRGSSASIADTAGNLLFYAYTREGVSGNTTRVKDRTNQLMPNGTNIVGEGWYEELTIIPMPGDSNKYYLFSGGTTGSSQAGVYYSVIDMTLNGGLGAVTLRNIQLVNQKICWCIKAVKHGNGRDWWVLARNGELDSARNLFYEFLITPLGVSGPIMINSGTVELTNVYSFSFSKSGTKMVGVDRAFEIFNFNRCTGQLEFIQLIDYANPEQYIAAEFSPNERYIYTSGNVPTSLIQYDLSAADILSSGDTLFFTNSNIGGWVRPGPDNKIYFTCASVNCIPWPYQCYDTINNNLSVINYPDSGGAACNFQPFSFNLGLGRTYWGLPNNPYYDMPAIAPCDTITTYINDGPSPIVHGQLFVFYHSGWQTAFINAKELRGKKVVVEVYDEMGRAVRHAERTCLPVGMGRSMSSTTHTSTPLSVTAGGYFTLDLDCKDFAAGVYIVVLQTENERLVKRFVKN